MAHAQAIILLEQQPLTNDDAAALGVDFISADYWQPVMLLQTPLATAVTPTVNTAGNVQSILIAPEAAMPGYVFYPIALGAVLIEDPGSAAFPAFWESAYAFATDMPEVDQNWVWQGADLASPQVIYDGAASSAQSVSAYPDLKAMPGRPMRTTSATVAENALGGFQFRVDTYDATAAGNMEIHIDARYLGFPQAVTRSAGFYMPRMYGPIH